MNLWVDDIRPAPKGWIWAKSYKAAMRLLNQYDWDFDIISLDHDLGGEKTGYDILCAIEARAEEYQNYKPFVGVHTANPVAAQKMIMVAEKLNKRRLKGKTK
jgi:hypothetical protein